ncbi:MAG: hypothetical protein DRR42_12185 [Gammaproteobacteria bacterium]|nr:MAG: hypothetical protein DRR42_12185 [Gammaproteobacteria bacterium]
MTKICEPTDRGKDNWRSLTKKQQHDCTAWLAKRVSAPLKEQFANEILSVGFGIRERGIYSEREYLINEPVLIIRVNRKKKRPRKPFPLAIQASVPIEPGRYRVVAIPTDVRRQGGGLKAQTQTHYVRMTGSKTEKRLRGSLAVLVRSNDDSDTLYALTCHHVAFLSSYDSLLRGEPYSIAAYKGEQYPGTMGHSSRGAKMAPSPDYSTDAALIRLATGSLATSREFWPNQPSFYAQTYGDLQERASAGAYICNARQDWAQVQITGARFDEVVTYSAGGKALFSMLLEYIYLDDAPREGDSGGALLDANGCFLGMHVAGITQAKQGFAIPAYKILGSSAFKPSLRLAHPVNYKNR